MDLAATFGITYAATSTPPVTFAYDANGNRTAMTDGSGTETYAYDALDRLTSVTRGTDVFSYAYDVASNLTSRTHPDGTVTTYAYDDDGRPVSATSGASATAYTYDPAGNLLTTATPDGFAARNTFDRAGRLLEVAHVGAAGILSRATYSLDPVGNRTQTTTTRGTMLYTYDALDRLTKVCYGACPSGGGGGGGTTQSATTSAAVACLECGGGNPVPNSPPEDNPPPPSDTFTSWTYDPVGNRLSETSYLGTTTYAYDVADRLTSATAPGNAVTSSTYDAVGNLLSAGTSTYAYDLADRLVRATVGNTTETYTWSGDGIRRSAATGPQATRTVGFAVDRTLGAGSVVAERTGNGALLRRYTYGLDLLAETTPNKGPYWYHHDGLGSVTDITSATGSPLAWTEYTPFGAPRASAATSQAPTNPFRFTGEYRDATTGLYHLRARQYDPGTGRFTALDPVSPGTGEPYVGAYVYVGDNPVRWTDPSGRCFIICAIVGAASGAVVGVASYTIGAGLGNFVAGRDLLTGLDAGQAALAAANGAVVGAVTGATFGVGTALFGGTVAWNSVEAVATLTYAGPLGSAAGIVFKGPTGQQVGPADAIGVFTNMIPLPNRLPIQVSGGVVFDQLASGVAGSLAQSRK